MPFDGILLQGSLLANQCAINGQSVPMLKKYELINSPADIKNSYIFEGSTVIQTNIKQKYL